jgi:hypothetical protein
MIFIDKPLKAYVGKIEQKGKLTVGSVSTSRKDKQTDKYIKSYWNAKFVKAVPVEGKIEITKAMLTNEKVESSGKYYVNLVVLEFEQEVKQNTTVCPDCGQAECECDLPF